MFGEQLCLPSNHLEACVENDMEDAVCLMEEGMLFLAQIARSGSDPDEVLRALVLPEWDRRLRVADEH